jgi:hypothetical protein
MKETNLKYTKYDIPKQVKKIAKRALIKINSDWKNYTLNY